MQSPLIDWATGVVDVMGYGGVALLMLVEDIVLPMPSEVIMPVAGFVSARYGLSFWGIVAAGTAGSLVGGLPWYYLGRVLRNGRLSPWLARQHAKLHRGKLRRAEDWFARHGRVAVLIARLLPGVRSVIGIPAGMSGMPLVPFLLYSCAGTLVWTSGLAFAGRVLGSDFDELTRVIGPALWLIVGIAVVLTGWWTMRRRRLSAPGPHQ